MRASDAFSRHCEEPPVPLPVFRGDAQASSPESITTSGVGFRARARGPWNDKKKFVTPYDCFAEPSSGAHSPTRWVDSASAPSAPSRVRPAGFRDHDRSRRQPARGPCSCTATGSPCRDIAVDGDLVPGLGMADIIDRHVVMLAPEKRHRVERLALPQHVACRGLALAFRHHPVLDPDILSANADRASARYRRRQRFRERWFRAIH